MAWKQQDVAGGGNWVMGEVLNGFTLDVFSAVTPDDILAKARQMASGWTPQTVQWERGVFGVGETLRIFGRANGDIPVATVTAQMAQIVNSFWFIAGATVQVTVSDSLAIPATGTKRDEWATALQWAAAAVIVFGLVYAFQQIRKVTE